MVDILTLVLLILSTWRVSSLLVNEDGPGYVFDHVRRIAVRLRIDGAFACVWCMSVWVGVGLTVALTYIPTVTYPVLVALSASAGAIIVHIYKESKE